MNFRKLLSTLILASLSSVSFGQNYTQTIRGTIYDLDMKTPILGAKIILLNSDPIKGAITNEFGEFKIENIEVGRKTLKITALGYQEIVISDLLIESGKEKILALEMQSDLQKINAVEVNGNGDKSESINKMALVSGKTFTVEETNRYAGSINDPARMVTGFAGVVGDAEGNNDIVVRGNSSRGILWRMDGIDIPNPNHFANNGGTGGPVNMLNGTMLANSDFFSGAFAPEYGNALSGVFDVKLRQGNNEKREYSFSAGVIGLDGSLEGPFKKGYRGSYLINYRYSSIALLNALGILDFDGIPKYQDVSFNIKLPTKKLGNFSIVGLGGISSIFETSQNDTTGYVYENYDFKARMGVIALKHSCVLNPKLYIKSFVSASNSFNGGDAKKRDANDNLYASDKEKFNESNVKFQTIVNYQPNKKNTFQIGATYTHLTYNFKFEEDTANIGIFTPALQSSGSGDMIQTFLSWKYRFNNDLTVVSGINHTSLLLNNNFSLEPRIGLKWQQSPKNDFSVGFGLHSRVESMYFYNFSELQADGSYYFPNKNLDFSKSAHFVVGYGLNLTENMRLKSEVYYQHLYNTPVENSLTSSYSFSNANSGATSVPLVNEGKGRNYGVELTLERSFSKNYYFLVTSSLYNSKYQTLEGKERNSRYNGNYAFNVIAGKEFVFGKKGNKTFGINAKITLLGGNRYTPIDLDASILAGTTVLHEDRAFESKSDPIFIPNFGLTYRVNKARVSHSFKIDVQNVTNNKSRINPYYDDRTKSIVWSNQLSLVPNLIYSIKF